MGSMRKNSLSSYKRGRLVEHFVAGTTSRTAASLFGVNRKDLWLNLAFGVFEGWRLVEFFLRDSSPTEGDTPPWKRLTLLNLRVEIR